MANGPALSTAKGGEVYVGSEFRDSSLDILHANQFEGEIFDCEAKTEEKFYRGAPPSWLNFHISEKADGTATPFIKRDGYETLKKQIVQKRKTPGISTIKLFHQQGCGGTTMAMQVLWDLRKVFRCAVLTDSTSDITKVAKEVVRLFTAGCRNYQNTVLLLVNDEQILENLQDSIMKETSQQNIDTVMPVVILLNCVRVSDQVMFKNEEKLEREETKSVLLQKTLSDTEKVKFNRKKEELNRRFPDRCKQFHGFNILQTNFSQDYIREACDALQNVKSAKKPLKTQLVAMLSLLNAYVPGSYLLESQCLEFLRRDKYGKISLEDQMQPFSHLIITFQQDGRSEKRVRMAHPMIAQCCTELLADAGVTRSDTARNFLNTFCRNEGEVFLFRFVKDMLTKRENKVENSTDDKDFKEGKEKFSRLILDITAKEKKDNDEKESKRQSVSVLKLASNKFYEDPFFPQALARFYYIELNDYNKAEFWAKEAKQREPRSSFVADTLGQVYKNHLKSNKGPVKPREILQLANKALEAFEDEEKLAEHEEGPDMKDHGNTRVSNIFNYRGVFGYLQVCNTLYDKLSVNETWKEVLTKTVSMCFVLKSLGDNKLFRFNDLIVSLRDKVEKKCIFFEKYMNYSKPNADKDDPEYISADTSDCYRKYVKDSTPKQVQHIEMYKEILADMSVKATWIVKDYIQSQLNKVSKKEMSPSTDLETALAKLIHTAFKQKMVFGQKYPPELHMLALLLHWPDNEDKCVHDLNQLTRQMHFSYENTAFKQKMVFGQKDPPELHMLALLLHWPDNEDKCVHDLNQLTQQMHFSYENSYEKYFRSRYLLPLFFIGKDKDLNKIVHRQVIEKHGETISDWKNNWKNETIFRSPLVQELLLNIDGVVKNYRLYATVGGKEIEIDANRQNSLWKTRQVTFYLGFTIKGPVAFDIQKKTVAKGSSGRLLGASGSEMNSSGWTELKPKIIMDKSHTYSLQSESGNYECSESALRWVCKERVSFTYQFSSWDRFMRKPVCMDYIPAGPLMDIEVTAGKMEEVHLPHWICIDKNIVSDMFRVLHVDSCGDYMEQVSEVTSSHVKLIRPDFSPRGAMIRRKLGFPVKISADVLIYIRIITDQTLHVYLMPPDPGLQQGVDKEEKSHGFRKIRKPSPTDPLQLEGHYYLSTDSDTAKICPNKRRLTWERSNNEFFEVVVRNVKPNFGNLELKLEGEQKKSKRKDPVWTCTIGTDDYQNQSIHHEDSRHFVDRHRVALIERVRETGAILDKLREKHLISDENYNAVRRLNTTHDQMREILRLVTTTNKGKDALYEILKGIKSLRPLMSELEGSQ